MRFDIVLPTIGRDSLASAVESVVNQTHVNWTLYIIGDGVAAEHYPTLDELYRHPQVECYSLIERHASYGAEARNHGISLGDAEWIAYIDDDDEWWPNHLETHARMIEEHPGVNMVRSGGQSFFMKHRSPRSSKLKRKMGPVNTTDILTVGMSHTRELFLQTPGWRPEDNHDHALWRDMLTAGGHPAVSEEVTFLFER